MSHDVTIDAVGFGVAARVGTDSSADVAALVQDVEGLQRYGCLTIFEEAVTHLGVPYQFVGVH